MSLGPRSSHHREMDLYFKRIRYRRERATTSCRKMFSGKNHHLEYKALCKLVFLPIRPHLHILSGSLGDSNTPRSVACTRGTSRRTRSRTSNIFSHLRVDILFFHCTIPFRAQDSLAHSVNSISWFLGNTCDAFYGFPFWSSTWIKRRSPQNSINCAVYSS